MPVQQSPPAKNTRCQRHQAVLTPTARAPLECTPSVHQLSANLDGGPPMKGEAPSRRGGAPEASEAPNLAHSNQPLVSQSEPNFLKMMERMTQYMGELTKAVSPGDTSKAPEFKTPSMKEPDSFDGTKSYKLRGFIKCCQLIFHHCPANFFSDRNMVLYSTSFLTGRAGKWIEHYLSNISIEDPSSLLNNWNLFEAQLFTLFGDPNEVRQAEQELDNLRMKESGQVFLFKWDFFIIDSPKGEELMLGYFFLYHFNPIIDWKNGLITYDSSQKDSSGSTSPTSNSFATAVNNIALVGELKTPSLPPSVHIPSIIPSQSLLPTRDEVFKEIKDV
ncbi:hypothetical protein O181_038600 [Austropuccinia psidii MF-1]|uniref:Retrotransposon gag domain-containing protein n=1 Tax=Austropuccinia psidii MF-1 TaxID=1389203 RepID=A0A9Q3DA29_9BASI|nr:hypothetical protein [Austropuccinia psidii MF-1]